MRPPLFARRFTSSSHFLETDLSHPYFTGEKARAAKTAGVTKTALDTRRNCVSKADYPANVAGSVLGNSIQPCCGAASMGRPLSQIDS